ncbi:hypothetical protein HBH88_065440 [Parastagonospora nodorum]|nr:hypothetical protein HBH94_045650 [Parastagonospora nodorum]KAH4503224.1 hypothetical protein HBH88_065440 [Parastagonospora nodorum]KAH4833874.1 hypothetical protein HBH60_046550 [Parastagonospora nodorum]
MAGQWYKSKANMTSSNSISQTNVREGYRITTLEIIELIEDLISYLAVAKCTQLQNAQIPKVFHEAAAGTIWTMMLAKVHSAATVFQKLEENYFKVIDALTITLIKDNDDLLGTVNSYIKLRRLRARRKTEAADSRYAKASRGRTKKDKDLEDSNTSSDRLGKEAQLKKTRDEEELAKAKKEKEEKEARERETYSDIDSKDDLEDEEATTAKDLAREQKERLKALLNAKSAKCLYPTKGERTFHCACERSLFFNAEPRQAAIIMTSRLTKEEAIEMQIDTTNAISKALAAANKLVASRSYVLGGVDHRETATKHYSAPSAARFVIVCSFRKVDKHVFRAYNTISVTAYYITFNATNKRDSVTGNRIYKIEDVVYREHESSYKYKELISQGAAVAQRFILKRTLKTRDLCLCLDFLSIVQNAKQQCRDILEKEGLNKSEASRRVIFNRFKMQAIAFYPALATLKAAQFKTYSSRKVKRFTLNSVKDLFTNLSKDYFLVREARAITKSSLNIAVEDAAKAANILPPLKEVCAKILIRSYKPIKFSNESVLVMQRGITQHEINLKLIMVALIAFAEAITLTEATHVLAEMCVSIVYFNLDSELELKVLGKQDVKTTS